jgi:hypothetical protein
VYEYDVQRWIGRNCGGGYSKGQSNTSKSIVSVWNVPGDRDVNNPAYQLSHRQNRIAPAPWEKGRKLGGEGRNASQTTSYWVRDDGSPYRESSGLSAEPD